MVHYDKFLTKITDWTTSGWWGWWTPWWSDTDIQFNDAGTFWGSADLTWNDTTKTLKARSSTNNLLLVDAATGDYWIGDLDGIGNSTRLFIDDTTKSATIATWGDRIRLDLDWTAFIAKLWDSDSLGNDTLLTVDDATANKKVTSSGTVITVWPLNSTNAPTSDPITISGTFTGGATTTYTITVAGSWVDFNWTDGTNSGSNVPMNFGSPTLLSNGISVTFDWFAYTPTEYWTQTYTASVVQRFLLDYKNDIYQMGNLASSWPRAKLLIDTAARLRYQDTWFIAEARTDSTWVQFSVNNSTNISSLLASGGQITLSCSNPSTFNGWYLDARNNAASLYFQNWGTFSYWWLEATNNIVKIWDYWATQNNTLLIINDSTERITVNKPLWLQWYTVAMLPTWFTGAMAYVTDALAPAFGSTVVWGWAVTMKVRYDGTNWIVW